MAETKQLGEEIKMMQMFDKYVDREYYKVQPGFFGTSETKVRVDRLEEESILFIKAEKLPETVVFNGKNYKLTLE